MKIILILALALTPLIINDQVTAQSEYSEQQSNPRVEEIVSRIDAKIKSRVSRYEEFKNKLILYRQNSNSGADYSEVDRLIRLYEAELVSTRSTARNVSRNLSEADTNDINQVVAVVVEEVGNVRSSFNSLHLSATNVVNEINRLSNN